jgi:RNA polymerase sigma factor (TIGR02999 family)
MNESPNPSLLLSDAVARAGAGDRGAYDQVFASTYAELKRLARGARMAVHGSTMNTTGIVHECYLRLMRSVPDAESAAHFLAIAARAMRFLIIEQARHKVTARRGGARAHESADETTLAADANAEELLEIDDLLRQLAEREPRQAEVVECRFFGGLSEEETAAALGASLRSVQRDWAAARAWMAAQG